MRHGRPHGGLDAPALKQGCSLKDNRPALGVKAAFNWKTVPADAGTIPAIGERKRYFPALAGRFSAGLT